MYMVSCVRVKSELLHDLPPCTAKSRLMPHWLRLLIDFILPFLFPAAQCELINDGLAFLGYDDGADDDDDE